jgi:hypothetical protein
MHNVGSATPRTVEPGSKKSLQERALSELEKYAVITVYLWLLFALFSLHRQLVSGHGISVWHQGFAIVNALVFGKVMLIGEVLEVGKVLERRALFWVVFGKSLIFAILLLAFHIVEEAIRAWFVGQSLSASFNDFGGSLPGLVITAAIFFVALIPFFAFQEAARVLGSGALWDLFFRSGKKHFQLIED